jgi:hypothetical protein
VEDEQVTTKRRRRLVVGGIVVVVLALVLFVPLPFTATSSDACAEGTSECRDGGTVNMASPTNLYALLIHSLFRQ